MKHTSNYNPYPVELLIMKILSNITADRNKMVLSKEQLNMKPISIFLSTVQFGTDFIVNSLFNSKST